jgi:hypothetical protein
MECFAAETFGPLCPLLSFETDAEAIAIANDTKVWILYEKSLELKLSGDEVYYTGHDLLVMLTNSCSKLHCQKLLNPKAFSYEIPSCAPKVTDMSHRSRMLIEE